MDDYIDVPNINSYESEDDISDLYTKLRYIEPEVNSIIPFDLLSKYLSGPFYNYYINIIDVVISGSYLTGHTAAP